MVMVYFTDVELLNSKTVCRLVFPLLPDARTDIYAVGVLLNVMLTGKHPTEIFARGHAGCVVKKCTSLNPGDRYQSAEILKKAL